MNPSALAIDHVFQVLDKLPAPRHYWVAYSGGVDSTALLFLLSHNREKLPAPLVAVHVNHQLSANAGRWEQHCRAFCRERDIRFESITIHVLDGRNGSVETQARELRYAALEGCMHEGDVLLTAHHLDDQAETVIQQLLRGGGPEGLAAIPEIRRFGPGWLARPLLEYDRGRLEDYVKMNQLGWVEDESNADQGMDRNYIRNTIMPCIKSRWPSAAQVLWRVSRLQADAASILNDMAGHDLAQAAGRPPAILSLSALRSLALPRQRNLLRYWIRNNGHPVPAMEVINEMIRELIHARPDGMPCIRWGDTEIRRYRDEVHILPAVPDLPAVGTCLWSLHTPLPVNGGSLEARKTIGSGLRADRLQDDKVEVRFRRGGERIRPAGRKETHELKKLFQDYSLPPWERDSVPLLYVGDELAAVAGYWIAEGFNATGKEQGWDIVFLRGRRD
ncbi:MAG: tRNA lysidine(34) synthetase TilS [Gammaproteobacteria bacterium]